MERTGKGGPPFITTLGVMPTPAIVWTFPIGAIAVVAGFIVGVLAAYYAGFSSSEVVLSSALGTGTFFGITALSFGTRIRAKLAGRFQSVWLLALWVAAVVALTYLVNRIS